MEALRRADEATPARPGDAGATARSCRGAPLSPPGPPEAAPLIALDGGRFGGRDLAAFVDVKAFVVFMLFMVFVVFVVTSAGQGGDGAALRSPPGARRSPPALGAATPSARSTAPRPGPQGGGRINDHSPVILLMWCV